MDDASRRALLEVSIAAAGIGTFEWDLGTGVLAWDQRLLEIFRTGAGDFDGSIEGFTSLVHPDDRDRVSAQVAAAVDTCGEFASEYRVLVSASGNSAERIAVRWVGARGRVVAGPDGRAARMLGAAWDITDHRVHLEASARRAQLMEAVTDQLTGTLDAEEAVGRLSQLVVPQLADWCIATLVADDAHPERPRSLRDIATWHVDPDQRDLVARFAAARLDKMRRESYIYQAITSGRPVMLAHDAFRTIVGHLTAATAQEAISELAPAVCLILPLRGRGHTVGVLTLYRGAGRPVFCDEELASAVEVGGRAGLALDNARLYREQRDLAEGLQRALLTPPPQPEHLELAVRYTPAAEAARVGGDWYDAFVQPGGATVVVIGDVVGHDTQAAAAMGQVRTMVRSLGAVEDDAPATILSHVDRVMQTLSLQTTASAVVGRLDLTGAASVDRRHRFRWSNAGHPPPMLISADGSVRELSAASTDLLLGVSPDTERSEWEVALPPGSTLLLYTDGLVERRGQSLEVGLVRLAQALLEVAGRHLSLGALCDAVLAALLPAHPEDDVALLAVRIPGAHGPTEQG